MKKNFVLRTAVLTAALTASFGMTAFAAGHWEKDAAGYWWQEEDGSYPVSCWKWLDGNNDGIAESYYFDASGYMAADTTVDGYTVNADGAWVETERYRPGRQRPRFLRLRLDSPRRAALLR